MSQLPTNNSFYLPNRIPNEVLIRPINKLIISSKASDLDWWSITLCFASPIRGLGYISVSTARNINTPGYQSPYSNPQYDMTTNVTFRPTIDMFFTRNALIICQIDCNINSGVTLYSVFMALHNHVPRYSLSASAPKVNHGWIQEVLLALVAENLLGADMITRFEGTVGSTVGPRIHWPPYPGRVILNN